MLSSSSKEQRKGKISLKNGIIGVDYKIATNMLMKHLYIAVQTFIWLIESFLETLVELSISQPKY